jgi:hypothetical protein
MPSYFIGKQTVFIKNSAGFLKDFSCASCFISAVENSVRLAQVSTLPTQVASQGDAAKAKTFQVK